MTFPIVDAPIRTDAHFDELLDEDHHCASDSLATYGAIEMCFD